MRAASVASGCAAAAHATAPGAPPLPAALLQHPVLSTYPCGGSLWQRAWHVAAPGTLLNPWLSLAVGDWTLAWFQLHSLVALALMCALPR